MPTEILTQRSDIIIRRAILEPGEALPWHTDACNRFTVVVRGEKLRIEYRDGEQITVDVYPGQAEWEGLEPRVHRAVNAGTTPYEEVVIFFPDPPGSDPQPEEA